MADFNVYPQLQLQNPDILGGYLRGAQGAQQLQGGQMALAEQRMRMPYLPQQLSQEAEARGLNLEQLRMSLGWTQMINELAGRELGAQTGQGAPSMGRTGGIQNGPQDVTGGTAGPIGASPGAAPGSSYTGGSATSGAEYVPTQGTADALGALGHGFSPQLQRLMAMKEGKYGPDTENAIVKNEMERRKLATAPQRTMAENALSSAHPERLVLDNPASYGAAWKRYAPTLGLDPSDPRSLTPDNARKAATLAYNDLAAHSGMDPKPIPEQLVTGAYGSQYNPVTGKRETAPEFPGLTPQTYKTRDTNPASPTYGQDVERVKMIQTKPGLGGPGGGGGLPQGAPATALGLRTPGGASARPMQAAAARPPAQPGTGDITLGATVPSDVEREAARLADYAHQGNETLVKAESGGYIPGLKARTAMVQAATAGDMNNAEQFMKQVGEKIILKPQDREYMTAMFPVLQTMIHKLTPRMSPAAVNAMISSAIPSDKNDLPQAQQNRESFVNGLAHESGNAVQDYPNTLMPRVQRAQAGVISSKVLNGVTYYKHHDGTWSTEGK